MSRLTRQQMKRDEMIETVGSVVQYSRGHTQVLIWVAAGLIALLLAVAGFFWWRQAESAGAASALAEAMAVEDDDATARERFQEVVDRYPRSAAAAAARLYLAGFAAAGEDGERARELWQAAAARSGDTALGLQARLNLWELGRQQGRHDEQADEIRALLEGDESSVPQDQLLYQLALTYETGGRDFEARESYLRLVDEHPQSVLRSLAEERAERLGDGGAGPG